MADLYGMLCIYRQHMSICIYPYIYIHIYIYIHMYIMFFIEIHTVCMQSMFVSLHIITKPTSSPGGIAPAARSASPGQSKSQLPPGWHCWKKGPKLRLGVDPQYLNTRFHAVIYHDIRYIQYMISYNWNIDCIRFNIFLIDICIYVYVHINNIYIPVWCRISFSTSELQWCSNQSNCNKTSTKLFLWIPS